jgi:isoamylase
VKALHAAGLEVILDVVYNHTGEGNHLGPMLCFKGADNRAYYRVKDDEPRYYLDYTGTGNSLNMRHPHSLMLIMDSLRYWVREMHVDGFRFDLASTLARELYDVDRLSAFFDIIHQDPTLASVKLIAEPWDLGDGGYQVGNFPVRWCEWNGKYRDSVRDFWRGGGAPLGEFARRFTGSADLYEEDGRRPYASVNFITAHDGFTLRDLLSYNEKHNEANGEDNADGESHNRSWNCGVEGETDNPEVIALRAQQQRNLLTTLLLSHGIPMLLSGDEIGRTQRGNNNAYCQDNDISWTDWAGTDAGLFAFCRRLITFRQRHPVFRRRRWLTDAEAGWFRPDGQPMQNGDWEDPEARALGVYLDGAALDEVDERGRHVRDGRFVLLFNAAAAPTTFVLPVLLDCAQWLVAIDSTSVRPEGAAIAAGEEVAVPPCGVLVLECG